VRIWVGIIWGKSESFYGIIPEEYGKSEGSELDILGAELLIWSKMAKIGLKVRVLKGVSIGGCNGLLTGYWKNKA
jgi:hypothetical protein